MDFQFSYSQKLYFQYVYETSIAKLIRQSFLRRLNKYFISKESLPYSTKKIFKEKGASF